MERESVKEIGILYLLTVLETPVYTRSIISAEISWMYWMSVQERAFFNYHVECMLTSSNDCYFIGFVLCIPFLCSLLIQFFLHSLSLSLPLSPISLSLSSFRHSLTHSPLSHAPTRRARSCITAHQVTVNTSCIIPIPFPASPNNFKQQHRSLLYSVYWQKQGSLISKI